MDGMVVEAFGALVGSDNDHHMQNASNLGNRLLMAQAHRGPGVPLFQTGSDKGLHPALCVAPMHNNAFNTPAQDLENTMFSSLRASNEWDMGRPKHLFKFIGYIQKK